MKILSLIAVSTCLSFGNAHALTISGQAPVGTNKVWVYAKLSATRKLPIKCTHYNLMGPIFNGGESHGWHLDRDQVQAESLVDQNGNYSVELDFKKLAKGVCRFQVDSLSINVGTNSSHQVYLVPDNEATETVFNFDLSLPYSWDNISEPANIRYNSVFEVNFR